MLSGRGLCVGLITRPEESYRLCVSECDRDLSIMRGSWPTRGCCSIVKKNKLGPICRNHCGSKGKIWNVNNAAHPDIYEIFVFLSLVEIFSNILHFVTNVKFHPSLLVFFLNYNNIPCICIERILFHCYNLQLSNNFN